MGNSCFKLQNQEKGASRRNVAEARPGVKFLSSQEKHIIDLEGLIDERVRKILKSELDRLHLDQQLTLNGGRSQEGLEPLREGSAERFGRDQVMSRHENVEPRQLPVPRKDLRPAEENRSAESNKQVQITRGGLRHESQVSCIKNTCKTAVEPLQDRDFLRLQQSAPRSCLEQYGFERLISERNQEKRQLARTRLRDDLHAIAKRRNKYASHGAFPDGTFEALHRNDIWGKVLQYISGPSDINSAYFSCSTFALILEERRKLILLPKVLKILLEKDDGNVKELLNLRGVSKSWKNVADMEIFDAGFLLESWHLKCEFYSATVFNLDERNIDRALNLFLPPRQNQSFVRKFSVKRCTFVEGQDQDNMRSFSEKVLRFLEFYGGSVWHFSYQGPDIWEVPLYDYGYVRQMILRMPALRSLDLQNVTHPHYGGEGTNQNPLPALEDLALLGHLTFDSEAGLVQNIFENSPNLKRFTDGNGIGSIRRGMEIAVRAQKIEDCCIRYENADILRNSTWPLKHLMIVQWRMPRITCSKLWPVLNRFSGTLEKLKLCSYNGGIEKDDTVVSLQLPRLKVLLLIVKIEHGTIGFDDLLHLKSLQTLHIQSYLDESRPYDANGLVHVFGIQNEMHKSNIWSCFPHLKKLEFGYPDSSDGDGIRYIRCGSTLSVSGKRAVAIGVFKILST